MAEEVLAQEDVIKTATFGAPTLESDLSVSYTHLGAAECLDELLAAGYHVGLATSSRLVTAERNLKMVGLFDKFETVTDVYKRQGLPGQ